MILRYIDFLREDHAQMELPLDGRHPIKGKPLHVQFIDAVEELAKECRKRFPTFKSGKSFESAWATAMKAGTKEVQSQLDNDNEQCGEILFDWIDRLDQITSDLFADHFLENENIPEGELSIEDIRDSVDTLREYGMEALSDKGKKSLKKDLPNIVSHILDKGTGHKGNTLHDAIENGYKENGGLINCWRSIVIDSNRLKGNTDLFKEIAKTYKGVGIYWSWEENGAEPYNGYSISSDKIDVTLHGQARVEDIDWPRTVYVNVWDSREEREITLTNNGFVKIVAMTFEDASGKVAKHELETPLIIPGGSTALQIKTKSKTK